MTGVANVQGGRGGDNCNGYGVCTDEFMGAIRVGSVRLKPSLNDTGRSRCLRVLPR